MDDRTDDLENARARLLTAALPHVIFDGWTAPTFDAAARDAGIAPGLARVICPRGALDLAVDYHRQGDRQMVEKLVASDLSALKFREKVARAVHLRLDLADADAVRRGVALFALPQHMAQGSALLWGTADAIWRALGDNSADVNWYTKRMTLSAVYSATVLYWLGDESEGRAESWAFLDRRIEDVMRFEKAKADFRASAPGRALAGPLKLLDGIRPPAPAPSDFPGQKG
ncbi:MAG: COQ9 family protein [Rhodobacteraceae bacterium]|nr:COQ9 family protein [Paracoccaceae bacterium]